MKRILMPVAMAAVASMACVESGLNDTDTVVVAGKALQEDKSPVAGETLKLRRSLNSVCVLTDHFRDVPTDAQGLYSLQFTGAETKNGDLARCFSLQIPKDADGASASVDFLMQVTEVDVPDLQVWKGQVTQTAVNGGVQIGFVPLQQSHAIEAPAGLTVSIGNDAAWRVPNAQPNVLVSDYALEDFAGVVAQLHAADEVKGSGVAFHRYYNTNEVSIPAGTRVPVSRGAKCMFGTKTWETGCPYTDGKVTLFDGDPDASDLRIDLGSARQLKKVVLRNFTASVGARVIFEGSTDNGVNWTQLGTIDNALTADFSVVDLSATAPAVGTFRMRVESQQDAKIMTLNEISIFD